MNNFSALNSVCKAVLQDDYPTKEAVKIAYLMGVLAGLGYVLPDPKEETHEEED